MAARTAQAEVGPRSPAVAHGRAQLKVVAASRRIRNTAAVSDKPVRRNTDNVAVTRVEDLAADDLPVVARLVIEIRSDGSRTIARGGLEDMALGQRVTVEARGDSPLQLALALAKSLGTLPTFRRARRIDVASDNASNDASSDANSGASKPSSDGATKPRAGLRAALGARKLMLGLLARKKDR